MYDIKVQKLLNNLDKVYSGPLCTVKEWDTKIIPGAIRSKLKAHGLEKTYDPEKILLTVMIV